jgi:hypothetical protein
MNITRFQNRNKKCGLEMLCPQHYIAVAMTALKRKPKAKIVTRIFRRRNV